VILHVECAFYTHESKFDTYACEYNTHKCDFYKIECDSYTQSVISTRSVHSTGRLISTRRVRFPYAECDFTYWMRVPLTQEYFDTYACEYDTHECVDDTFECNLYTQSVISTRNVISTHTRVISTRRV
jgi:hypothetical protein